MPGLPHSQHFDLREIFGGVYAATHSLGGFAQSNAGIIDLGNRTILFDTFLSPKATQDLLAAAQVLTGRPVDIVLNSHYHNDHIWGNQAVPRDVNIISTAKTRDLILSRGAREDQWFRDHAHDRLGELETELQQVSDETARAHVEYYLVYYQAIVDTLPALELRVPNIAIEVSAEFLGTDRTATFISYGGGHTASDAVLYLPDDGVLFMADLLFIDCHPWLADGDPQELRSTISHIRGLDAQVLVPGHGPVGRAHHMDTMLSYVDELEHGVAEAVKAAIPPQEIANTPIPEKYRSWTFPSFYKGNIAFLHQKATSQVVPD